MPPVPARLRAGLVFLVLAATLTACGGSTEPSAPPTPTLRARYTTDETFLVREAGSSLAATCSRRGDFTVTKTSESTFKGQIAGMMICGGLAQEVTSLIASGTVNGTQVNFFAGAANCAYEGFLDDAGNITHGTIECPPASDGANITGQWEAR